MNDTKKKNKKVYADTLSHDYYQGYHDCFISIERKINYLLRFGDLDSKNINKERVEHTLLYPIREWERMLYERLCKHNDMQFDGFNKYYVKVEDE